MQGHTAAEPLELGPKLVCVPSPGSSWASGLLALGTGGRKWWWEGAATSQNQPSGKLSLSQCPGRKKRRFFGFFAISWPPFPPLPDTQGVQQMEPLSHTQGVWQIEPPA